jgi:hypothetical protein
MLKDAKVAYDGFVFSMVSAIRINNKMLYVLKIALRHQTAILPPDYLTNVESRSLICDDVTKLAVMMHFSMTISFCWTSYVEASRG